VLERGQGGRGQLGCVEAEPGADLGLDDRGQRRVDPGRGRPVDRRDLGADDRGGRPTGDAGGVTRAMPRTPTITAIADPDHFADLPAQPTARTPKSPYLPSSAVEQRANDIQDTSEPLSNRVRRLLRSSRRESAHRT
jgi:hypothetical protein